MGNHLNLKISPSLFPYLVYLQTSQGKQHFPVRTTVEQKDCRFLCVYLSKTYAVQWVDYLFVTGSFLFWI